MKHRIIQTLMVSTLLFAGACSSDDSQPVDNPPGSEPNDDNNPPGDSQNTPPGGNDDEVPDGEDDVPGDNNDDDQSPIANCPERVGNLSPVTLGPQRCQLSGTLTESGALNEEVEWYLEGGLHVGDESHFVELNIEAGTHIYGDNEDDVDYVLVAPGSSIVAAGTAAEPVRFLSDDENFSGSGEWGGLYLLGYNDRPTEDGTQGANLLDYVVVSEAGALVEVAAGDGESATYQDNIVLSGVNDQTLLTFVQSHNSARDGFHIVNGNPRLSWILASASARDGIWYRDFNGLIKDLLVIHEQDPDGSVGRSGIYASESEEGNSNPRIVNATLIGRDQTIESGVDNDSANEFGLLLADNTDQIRLANVLIFNFRNGCFEADEGADLSNIGPSVSGPTYLDGVHCAHRGGALEDFGIVRDTAVGFPTEPVPTVAEQNSLNANGLVYYNGVDNPVVFTGEFADRSDSFSAGWYLANIGGIENGLSADSTSLNGFLDGDTNQDGIVNGEDNGSSFIAVDDGPDGFNQDVADDTGGYDLTHIGAIRSGNPELASQFDGWTVASDETDGFAVQFAPELTGTSLCPASIGGAEVTALDRAGGRNVCQVSGVVTSDALLRSDVEWFLEGRLQVGDLSNIATLSIEAGTRIRGDIEDDVDHILVFPGSAIDAQGTAARPVRLTSDDAGIDGRGEWGGLYLRGTNNLPNLDGEPQGANRLDYVVVAEGGAPVEVSIDDVASTHNDNVVVNGVDSTTTLTFVQSHDSARDGFHIEDGDPRMSWLLATGAQRDGLFYRNFNGLVKDLLVIHRGDPDGSSGRSGIYASETEEGDSNPRLVNITLFGADNDTVDASENVEANEFGILFADNTDEIQLANVLITNFRNGCYEVDSAADLSTIGIGLPSPSALSGVHCANETGALADTFGIVREGAVNLPPDTVAAPNSNGEGLVYYDGTSTELLPLVGAVEDFNPNAGGVNFTGELVERGNHFTSGWYLDNLRGLGNGLTANLNFIAGFLGGDTNQDGLVDASDNGSVFIISPDNNFNLDVADDTNGYDLTHVGAVRSGSVTNTQFDNWSIGTGRSSAFTLRVQGTSGPNN